MTSITRAVADDWEGIYVGGRLRTEGHSVGIDEFVEVVRDNDGSLYHYESRWVNLDWIENLGSLPERIDEVIWEGEDYEAPSYDDLDDDIPF